MSLKATYVRGTRSSKGQPGKIYAVSGSAVELAQFLEEQGENMRWITADQQILRPGDDAELIAKAKPVLYVFGIAAPSKGGNITRSVNPQTQIVRYGVDNSALMQKAEDMIADKLATIGALEMLGHRVNPTMLLGGAPLPAGDAKTADVIKTNVPTGPGDGNNNEGLAD